MKSLILLTSLILPVVSYANEDMSVQPKRPINCSKIENAKKVAGSITSSFASSKDNLVKINLIFTAGNCNEILNGNGHVAKFFYSVALRGNKQNELKDYTVSSQNSVDQKFNMTEIYFDESELDTNDYFKLTLTSGWYSYKYIAKFTKTSTNDLILKISN